jgi:NADH-quinone oxidoreductase subunit L
MAEVLPWFILFLPLLAAVVITLFLQPQQELSARISIGAVVVSFWLSVMLWFDPGIFERTAELTINWLSVGDLAVDFGLQLDRLSLIMLVVVTGVGGAIHIYSYDYMRGDPGFSRYFACLSFFTFAMLGVVLANNFFLMFVFWELVGVSSYLLIGFWYERPAAADAGKKAFLTNRLGDAGFLAGIILLWAALGTVDFSGLEQKLAAQPRALGTLAGLAGVLIFCGAVGKSAQFPLHVWLPDAMEGPTPVSALIHAATMVAAGVYMLCRAFFVFAAVPETAGPGSWLSFISPLEVMAWIGLITALLAAAIAVQQNDIKRILAYSTLSQLGYMVMAVGLNGPTPAMFHLCTHAAFKALLFLGAGSVIYALHHEQDIWRMGALRAKMPTTFWTFLAATLALCGVPPLSGFFSKDALLAQAYQHNIALFILAVLTAALTAFYMFRLIFVVFLGAAKSPEATRAHDAPPMMSQPMLFLTIPTLLLGFWGVDQFLGRQFEPASAPEWLPWSQQIFAPFSHAPLPAFLGLGALFFGFFGAFELYHNATHDPLPQKLGRFASVLRNRFYFDEIYEKTFIRAQEILAAIADGFDRWIVAGVAVRGMHGSTELLGRLVRLAQTGNLQTYTFLFAAGIVLLLYLALRH